MIEKSEKGTIEEKESFSKPKSSVKISSKEYKPYIYILKMDKEGRNSDKWTKGHGTWKLMTMHKAHTQEMRYIDSVSRKEGERGIVSIEDCVDASLDSQYG